MTLSLVELCLIRLGAYGKTLRDQIDVGIDHIMGKIIGEPNSKIRQNSCQLCSARGFICEACRSGDILYPFQPESEVSYYEN